MIYTCETYVTECTILTVLIHPQDIMKRPYIQLAIRTVDPWSSDIHADIDARKKALHDWYASTISEIISASSHERDECERNGRTAMEQNHIYNYYAREQERVTQEYASILFNLS